MYVHCIYFYPRSIIIHALSIVVISIQINISWHLWFYHIHHPLEQLSYFYWLAAYHAIFPFDFPCNNQTDKLDDYDKFGGKMWGKMVQILWELATSVDVNVFWKTLYTLVYE